MDITRTPFVIAEDRGIDNLLFVMFWYALRKVAWHVYAMRVFVFGRGRQLGGSTPWKATTAATSLRCASACGISLDIAMPCVKDDSSAAC